MELVGLWNGRNEGIDGEPGVADEISNYNYNLLVVSTKCGVGGAFSEQWGGLRIVIASV